MNVEADKLERQRSPVGILDPVQTLLIVGVMGEVEGRRLNRAVPRDYRSPATLRVANAESSPGIAETRSEVEIEVATGGHDHRGIVVRLAREVRDRRAHGRIPVPD